MNPSSIPIVIQATHASGVYEGKGTTRLRDDTTVLSYLIDRIGRRWRGKVILTTSNESADDALVAEAARCRIACVREARHDLVRRLWRAVQHEPCEHFVRVFGNYPLLDLKAMAALVDSHMSLGADYSFNDHHEGVPWGMGCEVISTRTLASLLEKDLTAEQREIGTLYIRQNAGTFSVNKWKSRHADPDLKLAFETQRDLHLIQDIIDHVPDPDAPSVLAYLAEHPLLRNGHTKAPPCEVGLEKLYLYPEKIAAVRNAGPTTPDQSYPISVELGLTNRCNIACVYCSDLDLRGREGMGSELNTNTLFPLFADLKAGGTRGVVIEGGGEPVIHPEFETIVRHLSDIGLPAGLITNGTRPLPPEVLSKLEWIRVSVDASTSEEWASLKGQDRFAEVLTHVRDYARHCPTVGIGYVVTNANMNDIETFVLRIRQHGVAYIQFRPVVDAPDLAPTDDGLRYLQRYRTDAFAILTGDMADNTPQSNAGLPCRAHSLTTVITAKGDVFLCGRLNIHDWIRPIGNIRETPFREIWLGAERAAQGRQALDPSFCHENCPQCRLTKFNRLFDRLDRTRTHHFI